MAQLPIPRKLATRRTGLQEFYTDAFIQDYSYAGYKLGEVPVPTTVSGAIFNVTRSPYNADSTGVTDATAAIQSAIDAAAAFLSVQIIDHMVKNLHFILLYLPNLKCQGTNP